MRNDGHAVGFEDREERLVRLVERHRLRRDDGRLDLAHLGAVDEALAGQAADVVHELGEIGVLQVELHEVPARLGPERHVGRLRDLLHVGRQRPRRRPAASGSGIGGVGVVSAGGRAAASQAALRGALRAACVARFLGAIARLARQHAWRLAGGSAAGGS